MCDCHGDLCEGRVLRLRHCTAVKGLSPSDAFILKQGLQRGPLPTFDGTSSQGHQLLLVMGLMSSEAMRTFFLLTFPSCF